MANDVDYRVTLRNQTLKDWIFMIQYGPDGGRISYAGLLLKANETSTVAWPRAYVPPDGTVCWIEASDPNGNGRAASRDNFTICSDDVPLRRITYTFSGATLGGTFSCTE